MNKINRTAIFCTIILTAIKNPITLSDINDTKRIETNFDENDTNYLQNEDNSKHVEKFIIKNAVNKMLTDETISYSIESGDNQIIRLLSILNSENTKYNFNENNPFSYDEKLYLYFKIEYDIDIYKLAVGFEKQDINSLSIYMNKYFNKLKNSDVTIEDIYDFNMIYNYFSSWHNFDSKYLNMIEEIVTIQDKEYLKQFIKADGVIYEHYNPITGFKSVPPEITISKSIYKEQKFYFPKEYKNITFTNINDLLYFDENISTCEKNDIIEYTIEQDPVLGYEINANIPTISINKKLIKKLYK